MNNPLRTFPYLPSPLTPIPLDHQNTLKRSQKASTYYIPKLTKTSNMPKLEIASTSFDPDHQNETMKKTMIRKTKIQPIFPPAKRIILKNSITSTLSSKALMSPAPPKTNILPKLQQNFVDLMLILFLLIKTVSKVQQMHI